MARFLPLSVALGSYGGPANTSTTARTVGRSHLHAHVSQSAQRIRPVVLCRPACWSRARPALAPSYWEVPRADELHSCSDVTIEPPISVEKRHVLAHLLPGHSSLRAGLVNATQLKRLAAGQEVDRDDVLRQIADRGGVTSANGAHADLVLIVRFGRA